jgi:hypothetical protein
MGDTNMCLYKKQNVETHYMRLHTDKNKEAC